MIPPMKASRNADSDGIPLMKASSNANSDGIPHMKAFSIADSDGIPPMAFLRKISARSQCLWGSEPKSEARPAESLAGLDPAG